MKTLQQFAELLKSSGDLVEFLGDNVEIDKISYDSRDVFNNTLFFCKGKNFKDDYLLMAKEKGAVAYISERKMNVDMPVILVKDIRMAMLHSARFFYGYPDTKIKTIGVTGTKGKSSTVKFIKSILDTYLTASGKKQAGIISTIDTFDGVDHFTSSLSTPEALVLYKHLYNAVESGLEYMVIETSSQSLKYNRLTNVEFDATVFLNIGEDHVSENEHPTFEDYYTSKFRIFENSKIAIYNKDSSFVELIEETIQKNGVDKLSFSTKNNADMTLLEYQFIETGLNFKVLYNNEELSYTIPLQGTYNIENAMSAILVSKFLGIENDFIYQGLKNTIIEGREEIFESNDKKYIMFVSYAHNEISFDKSFEFLFVKYPNYKVVTLYGNNANMAVNRIEGNTRSVAKNSDFIYIIPEDNGYLDYEVIYSRLKEELEKYTTNFSIAFSREDGIKDAFSKAQENTVFLIAGKGSEDYQKENGKKVTIKSDTQVAKEIIEYYNDLIYSGGKH